MKNGARLVGLWAMVLTAVLLLAGSASGDHIVVMATHTDAFEIMGETQPAQDDTSRIWLTEDKSCMDAGDGKSFIYNADNEMFYLIDHGAKKYTEMSADFSKMLDEAMSEAGEGEEAVDPEMMEAMARQMMGSMKITVKPTGEGKQIRGWNTTQYVMDMTMPMGAAATEMWVTEDIKIDYDNFKQVANGGMATMPGYDQVLAEMQKIKGIPVYSVTETKMMGTSVKTVTEIIEFGEKDAPAGTFDIPAGYKKVEAMEMQTE
jgi:hypothetical protein